MMVYQTPLPTESTPLCSDPSTSSFKTVSFTKASWICFRLFCPGGKRGECREATLSRLLLEIFMKYRILLYLFYLSYERKRAFRYAMSHIIAGFSDVIFPNTRVFEIRWSSQLVQNIIVWSRTIMSWTMQ